MVSETVYLECEVDASKQSGIRALVVLAVQYIRRMRGGAQGQLMLGADGHVYVVKFQIIQSTCECWRTNFWRRGLPLLRGRRCRKWSWWRFRAG